MPREAIDIYKAITLYKKYRSWRRVAEAMSRHDGSLFTSSAIARKVYTSGETWRIADYSRPFAVDLDFVDPDEVLSGALIASVD